jgi:hypothetical protein
MKRLSDGLLARKFTISRKHAYVRNIATNKKDEIKIEAVYPTVNGKYFMSQMKMNGNQISEFIYRQTCYVFEDIDDILSKKECDHIDRFSWNDKSDNIRWVTQIENKNNVTHCENKIIAIHK